MSCFFLLLFFIYIFWSFKKSGFLDFSPCLFCFLFFVFFCFYTSWKNWFYISCFSFGLYFFLVSFSCYLKWFFNKSFGGLSCFVYVVSFSHVFNFLCFSCFGFFSYFYFLFFIFSILEKSYLSLFFLVVFLFPLLLALSILFLGFLFHCFFVFVSSVWEKVNSSFVCWAIARTKTHATCEWDHLWNDGLWIKPALMPTLVKNVFFKLLILLSIPTWGVRYLSHVMTKLKRNENLVGLIWANKVSNAKGLRDVWDSQNWTRSSSKKEHQKEIIWLMNLHELEMIHGR